ncbi:TPA: RnfH family protein [Neisseria oralis]
MLEIEIAYGLADRQELHIMRVEEGTTVRQAALRSPIAERFPDVDLNTAPLGIFGKVVKDNTVLRAHDRIEVYRPLLIDPKDARRKRVQDKEEGR